MYDKWVSKQTSSSALIIKKKKKTVIIFVKPNPKKIKTKQEQANIEYTEWLTVNLLLRQRRYLTWLLHRALGKTMFLFT